MSHRRHQTAESAGRLAVQGQREAQDQPAILDQPAARDQREPLEQQGAVTVEVARCQAVGGTPAGLREALGSRAVVRAAKQRTLETAAFLTGTPGRGSRGSQLATIGQCRPVVADARAG